MYDGPLRLFRRTIGTKFIKGRMHRTVTFNRTSAAYSLHFCLQECNYSSLALSIVVAFNYVECSGSFCSQQSVTQCHRHTLYVPHTNTHIYTNYLSVSIKCGGRCFSHRTAFVLQINARTIVKWLAYAMHVSVYMEHETK